MKKAYFLFGILGSILITGIVCAIVLSTGNPTCINNKYVYLYRDETSQLFVSNNNSSIAYENIVFSSDDKNIATVSEYGVISPIGYGETTVKAKYKGKIYECKVYVKERLTNNLSINCKYTLIAVGEQEQLSTTAYPEKIDNRTITWSSSDPTVASIDENGLLRGIKMGDTLITATSSNGISKQVRIIVNTDVVYSEFSLDQSNITNLSLNAPAQLTYTAAPSNATKTEITWVSSDPDTVKVDQSGTITGLKVGSATITATTTSGIVSTCEVTIPAVHLESISIQESGKWNVPITMYVGNYEQLHIIKQPGNVTDNIYYIYSIDIGTGTILRNGELKKYEISVDNNGRIHVSSLPDDSDTTTFSQHRVTVTAVDENGTPVYYNGKLVSATITIRVI